MRPITVKGKVIMMPKPITRSNEWLVLGNMYTNFINVYKLESGTGFFSANEPNRIVRDFNRFLQHMLNNKLTLSNVDKAIISRFINKLSYNQLRRMVNTNYENPKLAIDKAVSSLKENCLKKSTYDYRLMVTINNTVDDIFKQLFRFNADFTLDNIHRDIRDYTTNAVMKRTGVVIQPTNTTSTRAATPTESSADSKPNNTPSVNSDDIARMFNILMSNYVTIVSELTAIKRQMATTPATLPASPFRQPTVPHPMNPFEQPIITNKTEPAPYVPTGQKTITCACSDESTTQGMTHSLVGVTSSAMPMGVYNDSLVEPGADSGAYTEPNPNGFNAPTTN